MTIQQLKYILLIASKGSLSQAAKAAYISQPSLSQALKELEAETGIQIFTRSNKGLQLSVEGEEFLSYARQVVEQYEVVEQKYITKTIKKSYFGVSCQHYSFATKAFIELVNENQNQDYEFAIRETKTHEVMEDVKTMRSEIGILYLSHFNQLVLKKFFEEYHLSFTPLFTCQIYVYLHASNPLSKLKCITLEMLEKYPCLSFEQGSHNSFFFNEEVLSNHQYKQRIKVNDRATMLNLMEGLHGFTLCSGFIAQELNGSPYVAIPLDCDEKMEIGYISRQNNPLSLLGQSYIKKIHQLYDSHR